jgi:hypothetical protein
MDFGSVHPDISSLAARDMAKLSCNIATNEIAELNLNYDSEEQYT